MQNASDIISRNTRHGVVLYISPSCRVHIQFGPEEIVGRSILEFTHPDDIKPLSQAIASLKNVGDEKQLTYRIRLKDGSYRWMETIGRLVESDGGDSEPEIIAFSRNVTERKQAEDALRASEEKLRTIFDGMSEGFALCEIICDGNRKPCDWRYLDVNRAWEENTGVKAEDVIGKTAHEIMPNIESYWIEEYGKVALTGVAMRLESFVQDMNRYFSVSAYCPAPGQFAAFFFDVTEQKLKEKALRESEERFRRTFDQSPIGAAIVSLDYRFTRVNAEMCRITGYSEEELTNLTFADITHPDDLQTSMTESDKVLQGVSDSFEIDKRYICKDGAVIWARLWVQLIKDSDGTPLYFLPMVEDITDRKKHERTLNHLANYDQLTGLPNRLMLGEKLSQRLEEAKDKDRPFAVLFADLDKFKSINDTYGHTVGDLVLQQAAIRLSEAVRGVDTVSRVGGDEFIILINNVMNVEHASIVANRILHSLNRPFDVDGRRLIVGASIGVSMYPIHGDSIEALVQNADTAMYRAKDRGRNNCQFFAEEPKAINLSSIVIEHDLMKALDRHELLLHYQPRIDLKTGKILGVEALVRWKHPSKGLLLPGQFIPIAEETTLIDKITEWVLSEACTQNRAWLDCGHHPIDVSVNISPGVLQRGDLKSMISRALATTGLDPRFLSLEMGQIVLTEDMESTLQNLSSLGLRIAIEDFGVDFLLPLGHMGSFPIDIVKIDAPAVGSNHGTDVTAAREIIEKAHRLKMKVVSKRVEAVEQLRLLQSLKCDELQGYFISPPIHAEDCGELLTREHEQLPIAV